MDREISSPWLGALVGSLLLGLTACGDSPAVPFAPLPGDSAFESAPPDEGGWLNGLYEDDRTDPDLPAPDDAPVVGATIAHALEEANIVRRVGDILYALNRYRGLYVLDIGDPDHPTLLAHLDVYGQPVQMYARAGHIFLILSDYFRVWRDAAEPHAEIGSAVIALDVSEPSSPIELSRYHLPGFVPIVG